MKFAFKTPLLAIVALIMVSSCKKEEKKIYYTGGTAPVLNAILSSPLALTIANKNNQAISFTWTNPDYKFTTGVSSQDVFYTLQFDTTGSNFTNPKIGEKGISKELATKITVGDLNTILLGMGLIENNTYNLEVRIKSSLINSSALLYSNVIKFVAIPYLDVVYPVPANLYITGSATPMSWQCACANDGNGVTQKFTKVNSTKFEITIKLTGDNSYLLIPVWSSWGAKYGGKGANNTNNVNVDDFKPDGGDLKAPAATGNYKIIVDFKSGKFTVDPV